MHGWSYDLQLWDAIVPEVVAAGHRVIRFDQRGHGQSPATGPYRFEELIDDLAELLNILEVDNPVLCGLSLGGFVAMGYAIEFPSAVAGLILADTCSHPITRDAEMAQTIPSSADGVDALSQWWEEGRPAPSAEYRPAFEERRARFLMNSADGLSDAINACAARIPVTDRLGEITAPTLALAGENDQFFSPAMHEDLVARIPNGTFTVIRDAGHISCLDQPRAFSRAVTGFLASLNKPSKE